MSAFILPVLYGLIMFVLGVITGRLLRSYKKAGRFMINKDDPTRPAFWLSLDYDLDVIEKQHTIGFTVTQHTTHTFSRNK